MNDQKDIPFTIVQKLHSYINFLWESKDRFGVHSPFVFDFVENVLNPPYHDEGIEEERNRLLNDNSEITIKDFGLGEDRTTSITEIAENSLKKQTETELLSKIVSHYSIERIIELGTSFGISTSYMAKANPSAKIETIEGSSEILEEAKKVWENLNIDWIQAYNNDFDTLLPELLKDNTLKTLAFIDGNHRYKATLDYFQLLQNNLPENSIIVLDDIHWSEGMEEAWNEIIENKNVSLSIDLFEMGIIFLVPRLKKEHFIIRY